MCQKDDQLAFQFQLINNLHFQFFVLARHGKTRNVAVWLLNELAASNANLVEFEQPKAHPDAEFQLPAGGVGGALGLRDKCIVVARVASSIVDIVIR